MIKVIAAGFIMNAVFFGDGNLTFTEVLIQFRKTCIWIAAFAAMFVMMCFILAMLVKFTLFSFDGFLPDVDKNIIRLAFYGLSAACLAGLVYYKKKRYSRAALNPISRNGYDLIKHMLNTFMAAMAISEGPAVCGLLMVFIAKLYLDFYLLSTLTLALIFTGIPTVKLLEKRLTNAL